MNSIQDCKDTKVHAKTSFLAGLEASERCADTETCIFDTPKKDAPEDLPREMMTSSKDPPLFACFQTAPYKQEFCAKTEGDQN